MSWIIKYFPSFSRLKIWAYGAGLSGRGTKTKVPRWIISSPSTAGEVNSKFNLKSIGVLRISAYRFSISKKIMF